MPNLTLLIEDLAFVDDAALLARPLGPVPKVAMWLLRDGRHVDAILTHLEAWKEELGRVVVESPDEALAFLRYISRTATERHYREVHRVIVDYTPAAEAPLATIEEQLKQEGWQAGRQEGWQAGRQEGRDDALRDVLRMQLRQRFGAVSAEHEARIAAAGGEELERALARVLSASDLGSVFEPH